MDSINKENIIEQIKKEKNIKFLKDKGITHLSIFGSYVNGIPNENSDIDFIYEKDSNQKIGLLGLMGIKEYLENLFHKNIDLVSKNSINKFIKETVLSNKIDIF